MITKLKIRLYGDACLRKVANPVKGVGSSERLLISAMIATMHHEKGIGLAAPQVGINRRIFVVDIGDGPAVFINPKIVKESGSAELEEGCLSIPGVNIFVKRPKKIVIQYTNEQNEKKEEMYDEMMARVIQHENDHLHGRLIIDYADDEQIEKIISQLQKIEEQGKSS